MTHSEGNTGFIYVMNMVSALSISLLNRDITSEANQPCVRLLIMLVFLQVRQAQIAQYNYILVVGGEEVQNGQVLFFFFIIL